MKTLFFLSVIFFIFQNILAQTPGTTKWEFQTNLNLGSPAIGTDGTIYTFTDSSMLSAINPDGSKIWDWTCELGVVETSAPVIGKDGTIYFSSFDGLLHAINPDGVKEWEFLINKDIIYSPAIGLDGTIYVASGSYGDYDGKLYALNPDGTKKWEFQTESDMGSPAIAADGTIYFGSGKNLFALNPDGTKKWVFQSKGNIRQLPVLSASGIIYVNSGTTLLAVNSDGTLNRETQTTFEINSSLAIGSDGSIYGSHCGYLLLAFDSNCNEKWSFQVDSSYSGYYSSTPAIGSNGTIYVGLGNKLCAINSNGTKKWDFQSSSSISASPAIASDGTVYFSFSWENTFYAVYSDCAGLADSPWPKFRKNNKNQASTYNVNCPMAKVVESNFTLKNGGEVTLDASPSYDPDGDVLSYLWRVVEMPQNNPLVLTDSTSEVITVDIPAGQFAEYRFSLKVTDNEDGSSWTPLFVNTGKKWEFQTQRRIWASPALGEDGVVYIFSDKLYAINADGSKKWEFDTKGNHLAIGSDGTIYASSRRDILYAFDSDGTKLWEFDVNRDIESIAIGPEGTIFLSTDYNYSLVAFNTNGTEKWQVETGHKMGPSVIGSDGAIYYCSTNKLIARNPDGTIKWNSDVAGCSGSPAIDSDGTIYLNSPLALYALRPDGSKKWTVQTGSGSKSSSPVIASYGTIYAASDKLYAINMDGTKKWDCAAGGPFSSTPAIGSDGTIYIGSIDSSFYVINPDGTEKSVFKTRGQIHTSPVIDSDGSVYFGSYDSTLYALYCESSGLADSPWPKYRKNNQNQAGSYNENCPQARITEENIYTQPGGQVTLDGSLSSDPDGETLSYLWRIAEKPEGSAIALSDSTSSVIIVDIPDEAHANFRIALTVTDNDDGYSSASVTISTALKWQFELGGYNENISSPAIAIDGTIYIGADSSLYAINTDGSEKWKFSGEEKAYQISSPSVAADGTVYISIANTLFAIKPDGTKKWENKIPSSYSSSIAIASDETVYFVTNFSAPWGPQPHGFYALNPDDGVIKWKLEGRYSQLCIGPDGTLYTYLSGWYEDGKLQAINPDSTIKWTSEYSGNSPAIGSDGTIYLSGYSFIALNPDGFQIWEFDTGNRFTASHAIGADGTIYAGTEDSMLYAIAPDGTEKWALKLDYIIKTTPAIGSDGTIFIGAGDDYCFGKFYAINPDGTLKWQAKTGNYSSSSPAIAADGTVYIASKDGKLSAFNSECGGLADSPWPKFNKDNQNTANASNPNCPVAKVAEQNFTLQNGGEITLDASPSSDPDGDALSYLWRVIEMPQDKPVILTDSTSSVITVNIPAGHPAYYRFSLKVTDNQDGASWIPLYAETGKKWEFDFSGGPDSAPVIGKDGTVYISLYDSIYAIEKNGVAKWTFKIYDSNDIAIGSDGTLYATSNQSNYHRLYALTPEGFIKWKYEFTGDGYLESGPAIGANDHIYIGYRDKLFAIDSSGTKKWEFKTNSDYNYYAPAIASDGTIYFASGKKLFALQSNGTKKWDYEAADYMHSSPSIASDGTIYVCCSGKLLAFNSSGTEKWQTDYYIGDMYSSASIGKDNTLYIGSSGGLYAFNPDDGSIKWTFDGEGRFSSSSPAIGLDGTIFIGSSDSWYIRGKFYAINPDGTEKWRFDESCKSSSAIDSNGIIYFSSYNCVYALHSESGGLANSPWPKYRHDNRNTGYVKTPTPIEDSKQEIPKKYALFPMYPNPFNPSTTISYQLPAVSKVELSIYNILGQKVAKLVSKKQQAGTYNIEWDASAFASGMYFIRLESEKFVKVRKCLLIK